MSYTPGTGMQGGWRVVMQDFKWRAWSFVAGHGNQQQIFFVSPNLC